MVSDVAPSSKPTVVFVPGAWHLPSGFEAVRGQLAGRDYPSEAVAHLSVGAEPPNKSLADDAASLRKTLEGLADEGKEIVVVAHSYGGGVGADAVEGLGAAQRAKAGRKGGIIMFVYMSAFVFPKGRSIMDMLGGQYLPWMKFEGEYGYASEPEVVFYHDLSTQEQATWISELRHTSAAAFSSPVSYEPWHELPCMYLFCENDKALPLPIQEQMAALLGDCTTFRCTASHSPFLSMPEKVVEAVELAARVGLEKSRAI